MPQKSYKVLSSKGYINTTKLLNPKFKEMYWKRTGYENEHTRCMLQKLENKVIA